jgi:hypothetical protein
VDKGKPSEGDDGASGGSKEGAAHHPIWEVLCIYRRQASPCTGLNLIKHNTSNTELNRNLYLSSLNARKAVRISHDDMQESSGFRVLNG